MDHSEVACPRGEVEFIIDYKDGRQERWTKQNTILMLGRHAIARTLANDVEPDEIYINRMIFGGGGTLGSGTPKHVSSSRNGLFGSTLAIKPVIVALGDSVQNDVTFTSVLGFTEANEVLNEMALTMADGNLYSMTTFANLTKTSQMQITFNWKLTFI